MSNLSSLQLLTTDHPVLSGLSRFPEISDLPEGKVRVMLRAHESFPTVCVKTADGIRAFFLRVDGDGNLSAGPELAANYRQHSPPVTASPCGFNPEAAEAEAQAAADALTDACARLAQDPDTLSKGAHDDFCR